MESEREKFSVQLSLLGFPVIKAQVTVFRDHFISKQTPLLGNLITLRTWICSAKASDLVAERFEEKIKQILQASSISQNVVQSVVRTTANLPRGFL